MKPGMWKTKLMTRTDLPVRQGGSRGKGALLWLVFMAGVSLSAQIISFGTPKNFSIPDYYAGSSQKRSVMTGAQAIPQADNQVLIKGLHIETYDKAGVTNLIVEAPQCQFDYSSKNAWSSGPLLVRDALGRFNLKNDSGFLWKQTNSYLNVSNKVRLTIRRDMLKLQF
jgi:hypothetical protein